MNTKFSLKTLTEDKNLANLRLWVHGAFFLFTLWVGLKFTLFYFWAIGKTEAYVARPPAVEGFLPISALLSLKRLVLTGNYDLIYPAGLTIFMAALTIGLILRKGFCGWICPVGFASNFAERVGRKLKILRRLPRWVALPLLSLKYILLGFFCYIILWRMNLQQIESFQASGYNLVADAKMLLFFLEPSRLAGSITLFLIVISFFIPNFWCRFLCPYGGLLGLLSLGSPVAVKRDNETCIQCKKCEKRCPNSIPVTHKISVRSAECIGCLECVAACPVENCLTMQAGRRRLPAYLLPIATVSLFLLFYGIAVGTGHWHSKVSPETKKHSYTEIHKLGHPSY